MPHLSYAFDDDDEFEHPTEGWLLLCRAIAFDSWVLWRHALPADRDGREMLNEPTATRIACLAERIHAVHQQMPGYSHLADTPFSFSRWWDPRAPGEWALGGRCSFGIRDQDTEDVLIAFRRAAEGGAFSVLPLANGHIELELLANQPDPPRREPVESCVLPPWKRRHQRRQIQSR